MSRSVLNLHPAGSALVVLGAGWLHAAQLAPAPYRFVGSSAFGWSLVLLTALVCIGYGVGLPELAESRWAAAGRSLAVTVASFGLLAAIQAVLATPRLPRSSSMIIGLTLPVWTVICWNLERDVVARASTRDRVFLVARDTESAAELASDTRLSVEKPFQIAGSLSEADINAGGQDAANPASLVVRAAESTGTTVLVLDTWAQAEHQIVDQAAVLHRSGVRIRTLSLFYEEWLGKLPHGELARVSLLFDVGALHRARYLRAKRVVDLAFALVGGCALAVVLPMVWAANRLGNRGSLFFRQERVGCDGAGFEMIKLRTMRPEDQSGAWTEVGDPRITPVGRWLRRTHLDELPQVVNIFRGELSLVGPRPEQTHYVAELRDKIDFYDVRHLVRPGITGWAQVKQGYTASSGDAFDKLQHDFFYLRRQGFLLDARIIWRTIRRVLRGEGR